MFKFKNLEWIKQDDDIEGFYSEPYGLKWRYSIIKHKDGKVEFAVLDHNYEYTVGFPKFCKSTQLAKNEAVKHYLSLVQHLVCR